MNGLQLRSSRRLVSFDRRWDFTNDATGDRAIDRAAWTRLRRPPRRSLVAVRDHEHGVSGQDGHASAIRVRGVNLDVVERIPVASPGASRTNGLRYKTS
ncbi:hypothetical protein D5S18_28260 [Nocardia panacis]|uniref:Uncharacterized protein n=1 Tax=Nocardia panacis TaxID=2340916 RepID=A0A3A4JZ21_9NOCA|nr:hypothetical protein D5S18_28260 [Nocardia panacis]